MTSTYSLFQLLAIFNQHPQVQEKTNKQKTPQTDKVYLNLPFGLSHTPPFELTIFEWFLAGLFITQFLSMDMFKILGAVSYD